MVEVWLQLLALMVLLLLFLVLGLSGIVWALWRLVLSLQAAVVELREVASGGRRSRLELELDRRQLDHDREQLRAEELDWVATRRSSR
jgi:hypothetical protein